MTGRAKIRQISMPGDPVLRDAQGNPVGDVHDRLLIVALDLHSLHGEFNLKDDDEVEFTISQARPETPEPLPERTT